MKKNLLKTLFVSCALIVVSATFSQALFQNTYTSTTNLKPMFTGPASGSGIIMCGATDATPNDGFISKTDLNGSVQWTKKIGGSQNEGIKVVRPTSDGGYIAVGFTESYGAGDKDVLLIKLDANGSITWQKTFGTATVDIGVDVIQTTDGGYAVCGLARYEVATSNKGGIYVFKTNSVGALSWSKMFGEDGWYNAHSIIESLDGGLLVSGIGLSGKLILIQLTASGNFQWYRGIMPNNIHTCESSKVIITSDNNYMILTYGDKGSTMKRMITLIKTDFSGADIWSKDFYFSSYSGAFKGIVPVWNGYLISGNDNGKFFTMRVDTSGAMIGTKTSSLVSAIEYGGYNLIKLSDGTYSSIGQRNNGILLVKCTWDGSTGCSNINASVTPMNGNLFLNHLGTSWSSSGTTIVNTASLSSTNLSLSKTTLCSSAVGIKSSHQNTEIKVFPNPFTDKFEINLSKEYENVEITIYDVLSHIIYTNNYQSTNKITINRNNMASGVYFYQIKSDNVIVAKGRVVAE